MKLYELTQNYSNLLDLLENPDIPKEVLEESLNKLSGDIENKAENIAKLIKSLEVDVEALRREEIRLATKRRVLETRITSVKSYLQASMLSVDKKKIKGKLFTLNIQSNPVSTVIDNLDILPEIYKEKAEEIKPNKKKIKEDIENGVEIPGARLVKTEGLRIR